MPDHDRELASAFDDQAERFERAPVQSDPAALERLIRLADLPADSLVLDAGCGPGLVAEALLNAGHRVVGVDLSAEMIARARRRCEAAGDRARFVQGSVFEPTLTGPFDAAVSRYVLHHVADPPAFINRQAELLRGGGVLVLCDGTADPDPESDSARWLEEVERARDRTHTRNLSPGAIVDLFVRAGLVGIRLVEEPYALDFDEWFDRGSPLAPKAEVRSRLLSGPSNFSFLPSVMEGGAVRIACRRSIVRGVRPSVTPG